MHRHRVINNIKKLEKNSGNNILKDRRFFSEKQQASRNDSLI